MPLRCVDPTGKSVHSFNLSDDAWQSLMVENREAHHLRMPCCNSPVVLKQSHLGTRFFAHRMLGVRNNCGETAVHLELKNMVVEAVRRQGWTAETEVTGQAPDGEQWRADVLAKKGNARIAVEIQWSGQTNDETLRRCPSLVSSRSFLVLSSAMFRSIAISAKSNAGLAARQKMAYVSNGCVRCDRLQGEFFDHEVCDVEEPLCHFTVTLSEKWRHAILNHHEGAEPGWGVYSPVSRP
jgi:hypothetical protein